MPFAGAHELRGECGRASASSLEARAVVPPRSGPWTGDLLSEECVGGFAESRRSGIDAAGALRRAVAVEYRPRLLRAEKLG